MYLLIIVIELAAAGCFCVALRYRFLAAANSVPEVPTRQALNSQLGENPDWYTAVGRRYLSLFHKWILAALGCLVLSVALRAFANP